MLLSGKCSVVHLLGNWDADIVKIILQRNAELTMACVDGIGVWTQAHKKGFHQLAIHRHVELGGPHSLK